ncbi:hypothetical protein TNCV_1053651 [Trichonephila clavipes]|nr:hypothetical protein TNCV_1053651 [Trichonephila clavipes]
MYPILHLFVGDKSIVPASTQAEYSRWASTSGTKQLLNHSVKIAVVIQAFGLAIQCSGSCFKSLPLRARGLRNLFIKRGFNIRSPDALLQSNKVTRSLLALCPLAVFSSLAISSGNIFAAPSSAVALSLCNVATPNNNSGRRLCWTRHSHVHLAAAAQPLFDPRGIEPRQPEDEIGEML